MKTEMQELISMLDGIPNNSVLYKDSGLWQVRSDDMEEVYLQQKVNESFYQFIKRVHVAALDETALWIVTGHVNR